MRLHCGIEPLGAELLGVLEPHVSIAEDARWHLVLDIPFGFASIALSALDPARTIVVSDNPCPEYRLDLLELEPAALLPWSNTEKLVGMIGEVWAGTTSHPSVTPLLTPKERQTLRLVAEGYDKHAVAEKLAITEGTLRNRIHDIYTKLGLNSGVHLSHYYYGRWRLLAHHHNWRPPAKLKFDP